MIPSGSFACRNDQRYYRSIGTMHRICFWRANKMEALNVSCPGIGITTPRGKTWTRVTLMRIPVNAVSAEYCRPGEEMTDNSRQALLWPLLPRTLRRSHIGKQFLIADIPQTDVIVNSRSAGYIHRFYDYRSIQIDSSGKRCGCHRCVNDTIEGAAS